jgi:hypothetical protein
MKLAFLLVFFALFTHAQRDSARMIPLIGVHAGGQIPSGDLVRRFGPDLSVGGNFLLKTRKNWVFGIEYDYMFGRNVKEDVLSQLKTAEGYVIDNNGNPADIRVTQRGAALHLLAGKVFRLPSVNANSGILIWVGAGALQHKIKLYDAQQSVAAIKGTLANGYDRLTGGFSVTQFVGYLFLSESRMLNFYFGIESYQAFTKSLRKLNYDTGMYDTAQRLDILTGLRFGWILPLYRKTPNEYYTY